MFNQYYRVNKYEVLLTVILIIATIIYNVYNLKYADFVTILTVGVIFTHVTLLMYYFVYYKFIK